MVANTPVSVSGIRRGRVPRRAVFREVIAWRRRLSRESQRVQVLGHFRVFGFIVLLCAGISQLCAGQRQRGFLNVGLAVSGVLLVLSMMNFVA